MLPKKETYCRLLLAAYLRNPLFFPIPSHKIQILSQIGILLLPYIPPVENSYDGCYLENIVFQNKHHFFFYNRFLPFQSPFHSKNSLYKTEVQADLYKLSFHVHFLDLPLQLQEKQCHLLFSLPNYDHIHFLILLLSNHSQSLFQSFSFF